jgi:transcriptional regulator with XRE-family HTH domain
MELSVKTPEELQKQLGERLRLLRISRNYSQIELAKKAGISLKTLRNLEHGKGSSVETLVRTLKALDATNVFDQLAPIPTVSPLAILRNASPPQRVRRPRRAS